MTRSHSHGSNDVVSAGYYHVVCRDCRVESLETDKNEARAVADRHAEETDHSVVVGRL